MGNNSEIAALVQELEKLHIKQTAILSRLAKLTCSSTPVTSRSPSDFKPIDHGFVRRVHLNDYVSFKPTRSTAGGEGTVIGFTQDSFCRIKRSTGISKGSVVLRKSHSVDIVRKSDS